jgi:hypothetical protein
MTKNTKINFYKNYTWSADQFEKVNFYNFQPLWRDEFCISGDKIYISGVLLANSINSIF